MSESAGRACAWQCRYRKTDGGWSAWVPCTEEYTRVVFPEHCETRELVPEQLLVDLELKVRALADELERDPRDNPDAYQLIAQKLRALTEKSEETR